MTVYRGANGNWADQRDEALLRTLATGRGLRRPVPADVLLLVEQRDGANAPVRVQAILNGIEPGQWDAYQDTSSGARAGSVIAVRRGVKVNRSRLRVHSLIARGVQTRWARSATLRDAGRVLAYVAHNALAHTGRKDDGMRAVTRWTRWARSVRVASIARERARRRGYRPARISRWITFMDVNDSPSAVAARIGARSFVGHDVMLLALSAGWGRHDFDVDTRVTGTDHAVLTCRTGDDAGNPDYETGTFPR